MTPQEADKGAHLFYGMPGKMYDQGYRFDFDKIEVREEPIEGSDLRNIAYSMPLLKDGKPLQVITVRPVTVCTMTGIRDIKGETSNENSED